MGEMNNYLYNFISGVFSLTDDDVIDAALKKMEAMGFNDDGGFLTQLLEEKGGDIDKVFDVLI